MLATFRKTTERGWNV